MGQFAQRAALNEREPSLADASQAARTGKGPGPDGWPLRVRSHVAATFLGVHDDGDDWLPVFPSDWECSFCGQLNTDDREFCVNCRQPRKLSDDGAGTGSPL